MPADPLPPTEARPGVPDKDWLVAHADRLNAEAAASTSLDQPEGGGGYTAVEPDLSTQEPCARQYEHGGHHYWRPGETGRSFTCPGRHDAGPPLDEETACGQIAAIIAMADDGADMLDEIMTGPVAALVAAAEQRGAAAERDRIVRHLDGRASPVISTSPVTLSAAEWAIRTIRETT